MECVECGGKGFYLEMHGLPSKSLAGKQGELVCCACENGYKYYKFIEDQHGKSG